MKTLLVPATSPSLRPWRRGSPDPAVDTEFARIVDELTRRGFLAGGVGAAALAGLLAACGGNGHPAAPSSSASTTRQVKADNGTITVPVSPKRIITLDTWSLNACLDLGANMVGTTNDATSSVPPQFVAQAGALPVVSTSGSVNLEEAAALKPDLIITIFLDKQTLPDLSKIAPVVMHQNTDFASTESYFADVLGKSAALKLIQAQYAQQVAAIRSTYKSLLASLRWSIVAPLTGQVYVYHQESTGGKVLDDLGAKWAKADVHGTNPVDDGTLISYEQLGTLSDADIILNTDSGEAGTEQQFISNPIVKTLPAAKSGHVFNTTYAYPQSYGQALQMLGLIDDILRQFA